MFTGIIEELGRVAALETHNKGARMTIAASIVTDSREGDSISVNGVCVTALAVTRESFEADLSHETLDRTTLSRLVRGAAVNLERAVTPSTRMGGHFVQGHVDGRGEFISAAGEEDFWTVRVGFPQELSRYLVQKGSVAVEGISLTVANLAGNFLEIAVIPKTWQSTNLATLSPGDPVNLEVDIIAKYVENMTRFENAQ